MLVVKLNQRDLKRIRSAYGYEVFILYSIRQRNNISNEFCMNIGRVILDSDCFHRVQINDTEYCKEHLT